MRGMQPHLLAAYSSDTHPQEWVLRTSRFSGIAYYYNTTTGQASFVEPPGWGSDGVVSLPERSAPVLTSRWEERVSKTTGRSYMFNAATGESKWMV